MVLQPKRVARATDDELSELKHRGGGGGNFKWRFPPEIFDGTVWRLDVANDQVKSAQQSFRNQCKTTYNRRAAVFQYDGHLYVQLIVGELIDPKRPPGKYADPPEPVDQ